MLIWLLAVLLCVGLFWHWKIQLQDFDWRAFSGQVFQLSNLPFFLAVIALMPINWWLEVKKFQWLLKPHYQWSFMQSLRAVLVGLGAGSLTPNRIGDYAGRAVVAKKSEVEGVLIATFQGGLCQWIGFLLLAWPGLVWVGGGLLPLHWQKWQWWTLLLGPVVAVIVWYFVLPQVGKINLNRVRRWWKKQRSNTSLKEEQGQGEDLAVNAVPTPVDKTMSEDQIDSDNDPKLSIWSKGLSYMVRSGISRSGESLHLRKSKKNEASTGSISSPAYYLPPIGLSILRLLVYCTQVYLLLRLGGLDLPYLYAMAGIAGVYLLQAGIPLPPGVHLMLRAELAATLFGGETVVLTAGITAFGLLYIINVLLPTVISPYFILQNNQSHAASSI